MPPKPAAQRQREDESDTPAQTVVIDMRGRESFEHGHLPESHVFSGNDLVNRANELPEKRVPLALILPDETTGASEPSPAEGASTVAAALEYLKVGKWNVLFTGTLDAVCKWMEETTGKPQTLVTGPPTPGARCWQPGAFMLEAVDQIESAAGGRFAVDVGCGSGRDMAFLAQRGWSVVGIDNRVRLLKQAVTFGNRFAAGKGCVDSVDVTLADKFPFRHGTVDLVVVIRFLHRPILQETFRLVSVGGFILYSHFVDGVQHSAVGTPKSPTGYLMHDELQGIMEELSAKEGVRFDVVIAEESTLRDGRPIVNLLAQRRE